MTSADIFDVKDEESAALLESHASCCSAVAEAPTSETMAEVKLPDVFTSAREGDFDRVLALLEKSPEEWTEVDGEGHSLLHWSALAGNVEFVQKALAAGVPTDLRAKNGQTSLMWAVTKGRIDVVRALLKGGADVRAKDSLGATAMILAVQYRQHSIILLLMCKVEPEKLLADSDVKGCTPVHWASYKGDIATLRIFGYFEADFTKVDNEGMTPLHRVVQSRQADRHVLELLLEKDVNPMVRDHEGRTCLTIAEENKDMHIAYVLKKMLQKNGFKTDEMARASPEAVVVGVKGDVKDIEAGESNTAATRRLKAKKENDFVNDLKGKAPQYMAPAFWLISVSLAMFQYLTDLRSTAWEVAPLFSLAFELGVPLSLALFFYTCTSDPGKVPASTAGPKSNSGIAQLMHALDTAPIGSGEKMVDASGRRLDFGRLCTTTFVLKGLRTKYCTQTGACVEEFDHFCGWLNCAIGKGNHRPFIALAFVEASTQLCHLYLLVKVALHIITYESLGGWLSTLIVSYPLLCMMIVIQGFTGPGVTCLGVTQVRMIAVNMTTNEMMNCNRYEHFWEERTTGEGMKSKTFVNPFHKGSVPNNCIDFWWTRRRGEEGPKQVPGAGGCGHECGCHH